MKTNIEIRVRGIALDERTFDRLLPRLARSMGMVAWWLKPGWLTLQVDPGAPYLSLSSAINQLARHIGGAARWDGRLRGFAIDAPTQERVSA